MEDNAKDMNLPENNDLIPKDGPDLEVNANPFIPDYIKEEDPHFAENILKQLENGEQARVGENILISRRYIHEGSGGESFTLLDAKSNTEKSGISLTQLSRVRSEDELRRLLE